MSTFHPDSYAEAQATHKPLSRKTPLQAVSKRTAQTMSLDGDRKPRSGHRIVRKGTAKKRRRVKVKVPSTKRVQGIFNRMVRERAGWKCIRCGRDCSEQKGLLHASHFWGVGFTATRFDFDNVDALCYPCHYGQLGTGWEYCKQGDYRTYMINKLGENGYEALEAKARSQMKLADAKAAFLASLKPESRPGTREED